MRRILYGVVLATFGVVVLGGSFFSFMRMTNGDMGGCAFSGGICTMSPLQHAEHLQDSLTTAIFSPALVFVAILLIAASKGFLARVLALFRSAQASAQDTFRWKSSSVPIRLYAPLQGAFARGILNTKAY